MQCISLLRFEFHMLPGLDFPIWEDGYPPNSYLGDLHRHVGGGGVKPGEVVEFVLRVRARWLCLLWRVGVCLMCPLRALKVVPLKVDVKLHLSEKWRLYLHLSPYTSPASSHSDCKSLAASHWHVPCYVMW